MKITYPKFLYLLFGLSTCLYTQNVNKAGTTSANFLKIGPSSRAVAMGGAFVSLANDASSMYWNTAGLAQLNRPELIVNHSKWIADIGYTYLALALPVKGLGTLGLNLTAVNMDEMEVTTYGYEEGTGQTFKAGSYALGLAYSQQLTDRFSIGSNVKYIQERISQTSARGFAVDIGTLFITPFKNIRFGANISNFGQKLQMKGDDLLVQKDIDEQHQGNNESVNAYLGTDQFDLPLLLRVGISGSALEYHGIHLTWAMDGIHPNDNSEYVNLGIELSLFNKRLQIRGGLKSLFMEDGEERFTLGGGVNLPVSSTNVSADYTYETFVHLKNIHLFSLRIQF